MTYTLKSIEIKKLERVSDLKVRLPSNSGILINNWQCCVKSVSIECKESVNNFISINTNLVSDLKYNKNGFIESFNPTIVQFYLKGNKDEKKFISFEKTWFPVNSPKEEIILKLIDTFSGEEFLKNIKISVFLLLQRVY